MAVSRGLSPVLRAIAEDFEERLPGYHKSRREGLVTLAAVMVETRSANLMELAASLPRKTDRAIALIDRLAACFRDGRDPSRPTTSAED